MPEMYHDVVNIKCLDDFKLELTFDCPILFRLQATEVTGPLAQFQLTQFTKVEMH